MKNRKIKNYFKRIINLFKVLCICLFFSMPFPFISHDHYFKRGPASEGESSCQRALDNILIKSLDADPEKAKKEISKFWKNKNGTFIGSAYYKLTKSAMKKTKLLFMDINNNFRPIYYIENDEASYPKIFKFIEMKGTNEMTGEFPDLEKEITEWITKFKSYNTDMENLINEYANLTSYINELQKLQDDKSLKYPFEIQLQLVSGGKPRLYKDYIANTDDFQNLIFKIKGKKKKLKGTSYFRFGTLDAREFDQAILAERLRALESEIRNHLAVHPEHDAIFNNLLRELLVVNRSPEYAPTLRFSTKLEFKEMDAEYVDLFKSGELNYQKIDAFSKAVIENLGPHYQRKLGINAVKKWVATMKAGRIGIFVGGIGTLSTGTGAVAIHFWNWFNYDEDSIDNITNAKDEVEFSTNLRNYLKSKFSIELISRLEIKNKEQVTLKNYNKKNKEETELIDRVNEIIVERKRYLYETKLIEKLDKNLTETVEVVRGSTNSDSANPPSTPTTPPVPPKNPIPTIPTIPSIPTFP